MRCEHCGSPYEPSEVERGTCTHCGMALPHLLEAERTRQLLERLPPTTNAPSRPSATTVTWLAIGTGIAVLGGVVAMSTLLASRQAESAIAPAPMPTVRDEAKAAEPAASEAPAAPSSNASATSTSPSGATKSPAGTPPARSVKATLAAHQAAFQRCQRAELASNPAAPRRYAVAITLAPDGRVQWFEVLSEASPTVRGCFESVARSVTFAKPTEGAARTIATLAFNEDPR